MERSNLEYQDACWKIIKKHLKEIDNGKYGRDRVVSFMLKLKGLK